MTITAEQAAKLVERLQTPWPEDDSAAEVNLPAWVIDLCEEAAAALIASEAARKLAEDRLARAVEALQEARDKAHSHAHDGYDGVWLESDFAELTPKADAILKEIDND